MKIELEDVVKVAFSPQSFCSFNLSRIIPPSTGGKEPFIVRIDAFGVTKLARPKKKFKAYILASRQGVDMVLALRARDWIGLQKKHEQFITNAVVVRSM